MLAELDLRWSAVESVPLHEDIKTRTGNFEQYIENYKESLVNLGKEGIETVIYNFMPVLDWVRTDLTYKLEDGSECLHFDPIRFAAFEIYMLKREGADADYSAEQLVKAKEFYESLSIDEAKKFKNAIIDVFPGMDWGLEIQDVRDMLAKYDSIDRAQLKQHFKLFLEAVIPTAEAAGVRMAVHPDDPPYEIMGLPRIVSCEDDVKDLLAMVDSPSNGLCFCTGSYSPRADNDLPGMIERYGNRINFVHLRSTQRIGDGSFYEANHLEGSVDMFSVVKAILTESKRRNDEGRADWQLAFRPDHGHTMMDDLDKPMAPNPGYSAIGRMRGLAEIRGLQTGISKALFA